MSINISPAFEVKNMLGRGKAYLNKKEIVKGIVAVCEGVKLFLNSNLYGKDKIEIEILLSELAQIIRTIPEIKGYLPKDFGYVKGKEKEFIQDLVGVIKKVAKEIEQTKNDKNTEEDLREQKKKQLMDILQDYLMKKNYMDAAGVIKKILSEYGKDATVFVDIARKFYTSGDHEKTIQFCKEALKKDPKNMEAYKLIINSYRFQKKYDVAEKLYQKALEVFGEHGNIYFNMAKLYTEWDKKEEARKSITKAVELEPENKEYKKLAQKLL